MNWIITLPKTIPWETYQRELEIVRDGSQVMNYKLPYCPKEMKIGDCCYVTWNGRVRGWMKIVGIGEREGFTCTTTGTHYPPGWYMQRSGEFHVVDGPDYPGFRGIRKFA